MKDKKSVSETVKVGMMVTEKNNSRHVLTVKHINDDPTVEARQVRLEDIATGHVAVTSLGSFYSFYREVEKELVTETVTGDSLSNFIQNLIPALASFGIEVVSHPSFEGSSDYGMILSNRKLSKAEVREVQVDDEGGNTDMLEEENNQQIDSLDLPSERL